MQLKRYRELTADDLNVEFQVHTTQTDGEGTIAEVLDTAEARGLAALAFTEHVRRDTDWFLRFAEDVRAEAKKHPAIVVYVGCEGKALDTSGTLDVSDEILAACDIVLGSVHRFPGENGAYADWDAMSDEVFAQVELELALGLMKSAPVHVLAHPGGMFQRRRKKAFPSEYFREMMKVSIDTGVAVEISTSYLRDVDSFLQLCAEMNPFVSIGSDVHKLETVGECRDALRIKLAGKL